MIATVAVLACVQVILANPIDLDRGFVVDPTRLQFDELSKTVKDLNTAVMGVAELIVEIDKNVRSVQSSVVKRTGDVRARALNDEVLAQKTEKLLVAAETNPKAERAKEQIEKQIEYNFLKTLSAILITGPVQVQKRQQEIVSLMRSTLNGELDFRPVVEKLPFLARENETARFVSLLKSIRETERKGENPSRQLGGLQSIDKILDAASKINLAEVGNFLKEIPAIFEGVESIVDGVDEHF